MNSVFMEKSAAHHSSTINHVKLTFAGEIMIQHWTVFAKEKQLQVQRFNEPEAAEGVILYDAVVLLLGDGGCLISNM